MRAEIISSEREFQIWKYTVGHSQLLLRSTKSPTSPTRIDVLFKGVAQFHLPTSFTGLSIAEGTGADVKRLCSLHASPSLDKDVKVFTIKGVDFVGYVAALVVFSHEDEGEYDDPSFFSKGNFI
jgi:hypothetical protein